MDGSGASFLAMEKEKDFDDFENGVLQHIRSDDDEEVDTDSSSFTSSIPAVWTLAWPVAITFVLEILPGVVNVAFIGVYLGTDSLAAASLGQMFWNTFGLSIGFGFASALDTLSNQSAGAGNYRSLSLDLQAGAGVTLALTVPISLLVYFSGSILELLGQPEKAAVDGGKFALYILPALPIMFIYELLRKTLQATKIMKPMMYCAIIGNSVNIILTYFFLSRRVFSNGLLGAAIARNVASAIQLSALIFAVRFWNMGKLWWRGFEFSASFRRKRLARFLRIAVPACLGSCLEWWAFEILAILAGLLKNPEVQIGANAIVLQITTFTYCSYYGFNVSASVLVGNYLGEGKAGEARKAYLASLALAFAMSVFFAVSVVLLRSPIVSIFPAEDADMAETAKSAMYLVAAYQIFDACNCVNGGCYLGQGRPNIYAGFSFAQSYIVGLPLGFVLASVVGWQLEGLWAGMSISVFAVSIVNSAVLLSTDWKARAKRVAEMQRRLSSSASASLLDDVVSSVN